MHQEWTDLLSAYLDGELDGVTRRRLEGHLADCAACAAVRTDLERIIAAAPGYHGAAPSADLWPGIESAIDRGRVVAFRRGPVGRRMGIRYLIAAGIAAVAIAGGTIWYRSSGDLGAPIVATGPAPRGEVIPVAFESKAYDAAVEELERTLAGRRGDLDTATVRVLEESLALIDRAIAEARAAIQRDASNGYLNGQIANNLRKKLNVLRLATRAIASET